NLEDGTVMNSSVLNDMKYLGISRSKPPTEDDMPMIIPVPVIISDSKAFADRLTVRIENGAVDKKYRNPMLYCKIGDSTEFSLYTSPLTIDASSKIYAFARQDLHGRYTSDTISAAVFRKPNNVTIQIKSKFNPQYRAGGPEGLIAGICGTENWRKGDWQGYQSQDLECVVDLQTPKKITEISANFLQDTRSWILMPSNVEFYTSENGKDFRLLASAKNTLDPKDYEIK